MVSSQRSELKATQGERASADCSFGRVGVALALTVVIALAVSMWPGQGGAERPGLDQRSGGRGDVRVEACLALDVQNREPVWRSDVFEEYVGIVYCWTRVMGVTDSTTVTHIWVHDTTEMARVPLRVGSPSWRTWSFKSIPPWAKGAWTVYVTDTDERVLDSLPFRVLSESQMWNAPLVPPGYTGRRPSSSVGPANP
jgi:hypothetical protein